MSSILGTLGSLVVSLETNVSSFTSSLSSAEQASRNAGKAIERNLNSAGDAVIGKLQGIAAAALSVGSVVAVAAVAKQIVGATAALDDMSESTGIAVEELSRMSQVAKIGGKDLSGVEGAAARLVKGLAATDDETKGVGHALEALGIHARDAQGNIRPLGELLPDIARELDSYADSSSKTAIAQDLFGKSGLKVLPFLKDYAQMGDIAARVTGEQAAAAEQLEKTWNKLALEQDNMRQDVVNALVPSLQLLAGTMLDNRVNADSLTQTISRWAQDGSLREWAEQTALALATLSDRARMVGQEIITVGVALKASINDLDLINKIAAFTAAPTPGNFGAVTQAFAARNKSAAEFLREWEVLLNRDVDATRKALEEQFRLQKEYAGLASAFGIGMESKRTLNYKPDNSKEMERALKAQQKEAEALAKTLNDLYGKPLGFDSSFFPALQQLTAEYHRGGASVDEYREKVQELMDQQPFAKKLEDERREAQKQSYEVWKRSTAATEASIAAAEKLVEGMEFEVEALRMTNAEREIAIALRNLEGAGVFKSSEAYEEYAKRIRAAVEAKEGMKDQIDLWKSIESAAHQAWQSIGQDGENVFKQLGRTLKSAILDLLYQMTVKRWVISIAAGVNGMSPEAMAAQMGTTYMSGGSGMFGGIAGAAGTVGEFYTGASTGAMVYAPGTAGFYGSQLAGHAASWGGYGSMATAYGVSGLAGGVVGYGLTSALGAGERGQQVGMTAGAIGAMIGTYILPGIGTAIGAILGGLVGYFTDPDDLAQRSATFGQIGPGTSGIAYESTSAFGRFGFSDTDWFSDSDMGDSLRAFLQLQTGIDNAVYSMADADQRRRIQERLGASTRDYDFGIEHGDFSQQLATVARDRLSILVSELYPDMERFVRDFQGELGDLYTYVASFLNFRALIGDIQADSGPLAVARNAFEESQNVFATAARRNQEAMDAAIDSYDGSAAATENLTRATAEYYIAQVNLLAQIETIRLAISEMFGNTARNIQLAGMDDQGRYDFYMVEANRLFEQLMASSDPEQIRRFAERINENIGAAFALLSPEEQAAMSADFLERLSRAEEAVDARLREVESQLEDRTTNVLDRVQVALDKAAQDQLDAAAAQLDAGNLQLEAARTPHTLVVEVPSAGQVITFGE